MHPAAKSVSTDAESNSRHIKSLASKSKSKLSKSANSPKPLDTKNTEAGSYSPLSPGSTSSLKENDSMTNGIANANQHTTISSQLDTNSNKLSQSHVYYQR